MFKKEILFYNVDDISPKNAVTGLNKKPMTRAKLYFKYNEKLTDSEKKVNSEKFILIKLLQVLKENKIIDSNHIISFNIKINRSEDPLYKYREYNIYNFDIILISKNSKIIKLSLEYDTFYKELYRIFCILYNQYNNKNIKKINDALHSFLDNFNKDYKKYIFGSQDLQIKY